MTGSVWQIRKLELMIVLTVLFLVPPAGKLLATGGDGLDWIPASFNPLQCKPALRRRTGQVSLSTDKISALYAGKGGLPPQFSPLLPCFDQSTSRADKASMEVNSPC